MNPRSETSLRGFFALVACQFQAAFNDHAFKNLLLVVLLGTATDEKSRFFISSAIPALFIAPFVLFSLSAGSLADRISKQKILAIAKGAEILVMLAGGLAFISGNIGFSILILFLMGTQSAFFGPSKYGIIPELIPEKHLSWANGIMELSTFAAIILGTFTGTLMFEHFSGNLSHAMIILFGLSVIGFLFSFGIPHVPAADPNRKGTLFPWSELVNNLRLASQDRVLWLAIWGNSFFWFLSGLIFTNIPVFGLDVLHLKETEMGTLMVALAVGIGIGSYAAGHLSGNKIEYGLIPLGAILIMIFSLDLAWFAHSYFRAMTALAFLGAGAGFLSVPINAIIQHRPDSDKKGGIQGTTYFLSNVGVLLASAVYGLLTLGLKFNSQQVYIAATVLTIAGTIYAVRLLPEFLLRLILWLMTHTLYKVQVSGRDNIPDKGGALFIANHLSFLDALFVIASTDRFVRFIMAEEYYRQSWINPLARMMRIIPIAGDSGVRALLKSLRDASQTIRDGDVVCIFAEGQMTRTGQMLPFRRGFEKIMRGVDAPIIPIHLDRLWGSIFSFEGGRFFWKKPRRLFDPITVTYGSPMPPTATAVEVRRTVMELASDAFRFRRVEMEPLHHAFIRQARSHFGRFAMADGNNPHLTFGQVLIKSLILAKKLKNAWAGQEMVGLLLPSSTAGACMNIAALLGGKIPVNLNFTVGQEAINSAARQCNVQTIVTSRLFLERLKVQPPPGKVLFLEDIAAEVSFPDKLFGWFQARFFPRRLLEFAAGSRKSWNIDEPVTVIFSSGSTGEPKGVMLSHYNIFSNLEGTGQLLQVTPQDCIMGVLPFFHSFGFTGTLWFPLLKGFGAVYHPNPLDSRVIGALAARYAVTILVSTPTFLQAYMRRVQPEQFGSLKLVLVGAEKLTDRIALAFEERFGIRPMEAYGCTECSPAVAMNVPGFRAAGFYQVGAKRGRIGHPLPGVTVKIVDPDTRAPLPVNTPGLLLVKGPNVMLGYLGQPEKTAQVIVDGFYNTGDIASVDEDGFVTITDRLSRFAKVGGEMVPLVKVEDMLHQLSGITTQTFAVAAVPDERKGERLIVLHLLAEEKLKPVLEKLPNSGLPNLWIPRPDSFFRVDAFPTLGTGKLDLRGLREKAAEISAKTT